MMRGAVEEGRPGECLVGSLGAYHWIGGEVQEDPMQERR